MFRMSKTKGNKIFFSHHATQPLIAAAAAAADKTTSFDQTTFILELNLGVFDRDESRASSMSPSPMPQGTLVAEAFQIEVGCKTGRWWSSLFFKPVEIDIVFVFLGSGRALALGRGGVPTLRSGADPAPGQRRLLGRPGLSAHVRPPVHHRDEVQRRAHVALGQGALHQGRQVRHRGNGSHRVLRQHEGKLKIPVAPFPFPPDLGSF